MKTALKPFAKPPGWYTELVTSLPQVHRGEIGLPDAPGLGLDLLPGLTRRQDATGRTTSDRS